MRRHVAQGGLTLATFTQTRMLPSYEIWEVERGGGRRVYRLMVNRHDLRGWQWEGTVAGDMVVVVARQVELEERDNG
jgi:hypothetical protein